MKSEIAQYVTLTPTDVEKTYDGTTYTAGTARATDKNGKTVKIEYQKADGNWTENPADITATNVADSIAVINVRASVADSYEGYVTGTQKLVINKRDVTVTGDGWSSDQPYTGQKYEKDTYSFEGIVSGETATITYHIEGTEVGPYTGTFGDDFKVIKIGNGMPGYETTDTTANYNLTEKTPGTLNIVKVGGNDVTPEPPEDDKSMEVDGTNLTAVYDGNAHTVTATAVKEGSTIEYKYGDGDWTTTAPTLTDAGEIEFSVRATNPNYETVTKEGYKLIVTKRNVTLTSATDSKTYDGTPLTNSNVTVGGDGWATGEGATYNVTGSQTDVGSSANTFEYTLNEGTKASNYNITKAEGTLTVNEVPFVPQPDYTVKKTAEFNGAPVSADTKVNVGDVVHYVITVTNTGNVDLTGITVEDSLVPSAGETFNLAIGAEKKIEYDYTVTQADVDSGSVKNVAAGKGGGTDPKDDEITVPAVDPEPKLDVNKKASPSKNAKEGTVITYTITVKNTGNVTISGIDVSDTLVNFSGNDTNNITLGPGDTATITYSYKVTAADVEAGSVVNTATATGTAPDGTTKPSDSDSVTVTTEEDEEEEDDDTPTPTPTPPAPAGPAGPAPGPAPAGPGVVPAAPDGNDGAVVPDNPVPEVEPEVDIDDNDTPLAEGTWAVINLIAAILTTLGAIVALFRKKEEEDEDEEDQNKDKAEDEDEDDNRGKKMLAAKIAGAVAGVLAPIVFILTEDMSLPMALIDKWTLLMAVVLVAQIMAAIFNKKASELDDDKEEEAEPAN